jgi:hypothetical protein
MKRSALLFAGAASLAGCAGNQATPMNAESNAALKQAPVIQVVRYVSPGMNITIPKNASGLGPLGSVLVGAGTGTGEMPTGDSLARAYKLPDPADDVARRLVEKLKTEGALANLRVEPKLAGRPLAEDPAHYRAKYPNAVVLELSVENQGASYGAVNWKTYTYFMYGKARLIRVSDGKVLWSDSCNLHAFGDDAAKRQLDVTEFEANNGKRLKEVTSYSNERCSRMLADKILAKGS